MTWPSVSKVGAEDGKSPGIRPPVGMSVGRRRAQVCGMDVNYETAAHIGIWGSTAEPFYTIPLRLASLIWMTR